MYGCSTAPTGPTSVVVTMQDVMAVEEQERLRAEFLAMVSHELRMLLTSIRGAATGFLDAAQDLTRPRRRRNRYPTVCSSG